MDPGCSLRVEQKVQTWGNGLGIRITSPLAKAARLQQGQPITIEVVAEGLLLRPQGAPPAVVSANARTL